jgi:hypothetical protein
MHACGGANDHRRSRRAEGDQHSGLDERDLLIKPGATGKNLVAIRPLVNAALAALDPS